MAIAEETAKRFDAAMPPRGLDLAQTVRTAAQGGGLALASGTATVANGATTVVVAVGADWNGSQVFLTPAQADTYASVHWFGAVAGGNLTITVDTDPGNAAGLAFNYLLIKTTALT